MLLLCQQVRLVEGDDHLVWGLDEGCGFSVRSLKVGLEASLEMESSYLMEWNNFVPKKVGIHAWRVEMERIPVLFSLAKRGIPVPSVVCPVCEVEVESAEHVTISCYFAQSVWSVIETWCKVLPIYTFSVKDVLELHRHSSLSSRKAKVFHAVCLTTIWCLWRARNAVVFERKLMTVF
ncbi:uncharacterized protein LOC143580647 [Bidens hawaiensis]|uniref:uncharacterized protein LOC143580647 n=1 Tax=Bidens hawaiensis TaxID=980011 RepID=UPI004049CF92